MTVARDNAAFHAVADRIEFRCGDLCTPLENQAFDVIVSNPPYVSEAEFEQCDRTVKEFEPRQALVAGPTGLEIYQRLVPEAKDRLHPNGWLVLETSPMLAESLKQLLAEQGYRNVDIKPDHSGNPRVVIGQI